MRPVEDAFHVSVACHVQGVHAHGVMAHADDRQMRQIFVLQLHVADRVGIGYIRVVGVGFRIGPSGIRIGHKARSGLTLRPVSGFGGYRFRDHVLEGEILLNDRHSRINVPFLAVVIGRDNGDQHIRVMPDLIRLDMILIIAGMVALIVIHFILQLPLLFRVDTLSGPDILFLSGIGAYDDGFQYGLRQRRTCLEAAHDDQKHTAQGEDQQDGRMTADDLNGFPGGIADLFCSLLSVLRCVLYGSAAFPALGCGVFPANGTLLLPAGIGIAGELRMLLPVLLFHHTDVSLIQPLFRFFQPLVGTHLMRMIGMFTHLQG